MGNVEMKKSLDAITKQLERITHQTSHEVLADGTDRESEADGTDRESKVVIAGGRKGGRLNSVEMFSLATGTWTPLQPMTKRRQGASSVVYNNQIFVSGGYTGNTWIKSMEKLSLNAVQVDQSITWENFPAKLPGRLYGHCSVVCNERLIVIGGFDADKAAYVDSITEISLVPHYTSELLVTMPQTRGYHGVAMFGDKILIVGGRESVRYGSALRNVVMYDVTNNECQELAPLPYPVSEMATVKWGDDNVIIMGGADSDGETLNKVLLYNIKTQKSHMLPDMKYKRKGCVAAVVRDTVIVMGGKDERDKRNYYLKSVESFRFDNYSWQELPEMHEGRYAATAVVC